MSASLVSCHTAVDVPTFLTFIWTIEFYSYLENIHEHTYNKREQNTFVFPIICFQSFILATNAIKTRNFINISSIASTNLYTPCKFPIRFEWKFLFCILYVSITFVSYIFSACVFFSVLSSILQQRKSSIINIHSEIRDILATL